MTFTFDSDIACEYGVDGALMVDCFQFWISTNRANRTNRKPAFYDGEARTWTYNSVRAWAELFPFWTAKQVRRVLDNLQQKGVILAERHGEPGDQTYWYAFVDEARFIGTQTICPNRQKPLARTVTPFAQTGKSTIDTVGITSSTLPPAREREGDDRLSVGERLYAQAFGDDDFRALNTYQRDLLRHMGREDADALEATIAIWLGNGHKPTSIHNLRDRYQKVRHERAEDPPGARPGDEHQPPTAGLGAAPGVPPGRARPEPAEAGGDGAAGRPAGGDPAARGYDRFVEGPLV